MKLYERYRAFEQIDSLRRYGVVLFRLQTASNTIAALNEKGKEKRASKTIKQQAFKNQELMTEFRTHFDFCPIYFFYSNSIGEVMKRNIVGHLVDDSLADTIEHSPQLDYAFIVSYSVFQTIYYPHRAEMTSWNPSDDSNSPMQGYNLKDLDQNQYFSPPLPFYGMNAIEWNSSLMRFYRKSRKRMPKLLRKPNLLSAFEKLDYMPSSNY